jgi:diguanylate cyclase (GGDEF)-like protein
VAIDPQMRSYADTLYLRDAQSSGEKFRQDLTILMRDAAKRGFVGFSGMEMSGVIRLQAEHVGRLTTARLRGFMEAYEHARRSPTSEDFDEILQLTQESYNTALTQGIQYIRQYGNQRGALNDHSSGLEPAAGHFHDSVLSDWKVWRAKSAVISTDEKSRDLGPRDHLTGIYNRQSLDSELQKLAASDKPKPVSVIMIDLDGFKQVNDNHGHLAGDEALKKVARVLVDVTEPKGNCFRYGGDEFTIVLPNSTIEEAMPLAERIRAAISASGNVTASIGAASSSNGAEVMGLLGQADAAAQAAKRNGKNQVQR